MRFYVSFRGFARADGAPQSLGFLLESLVTCVSQDLELWVSPPPHFSWRAELKFLVLLFFFPSLWIGFRVCNALPTFPNFGALTGLSPRPLLSQLMLPTIPKLWFRAIFPHCSH